MNIKNIVLIKLYKKVVSMRVKEMLRFLVLLIAMVPLFASAVVTLIDDTYIADINQSLIAVSAAEGVLSNDLVGSSQVTNFGVEGGGLDAPGTSVTTSLGTLTMDADGSFEYQPNFNFALGTDFFEYTVDGITATLVIEVYDSLVTIGAALGADSYAVAEQSQMSVTFGRSVLLNDQSQFSFFEVEGIKHGTESTYSTVFSGPVQGSFGELEVTSSGVVTYTPNNVIQVAVSGDTDFFDYQVLVEGSFYAGGIEIVFGEDPLGGVPDVYQIDSIDPTTIDAPAGVLSNDINSGADPSVYEFYVVNQFNSEAPINPISAGGSAFGTYGQVQLNQDGSFTYSPFISGGPLTGDTETIYYSTIDLFAGISASYTPITLEFVDITTDSDGDGLTDIEENNGNPATDPNLADTDGDGLNDFDEVNGPTDPTLADTDVDGVDDGLDAFPNDPSEQLDSDGDGVGDNADAFPSDSAASVDSDGDGRPDAWNEGQDASTSTSNLFLDAYPGNKDEWFDNDSDSIPDNDDDDIDGDGIANNEDPDRDGDFIPNVAEVHYGLNPDAALDAGFDDDNDGFTNAEEINGRSDHLDLNDTPSVGYLEFSASRAYPKEGESLPIRVRRDGGAAGAVSAQVLIDLGRSTGDLSDLAGGSNVVGSVSWAAGEVGFKEVFFEAIDDNVAEASEAFRLTLLVGEGIALGQTPETFIHLEDVEIEKQPGNLFPGGVVEVSTWGGSYSESLGFVEVDVSRQGGSVGPASVLVSLTDLSGDGYVDPGFDFVPSSVVVEWTDGESGIKTVRVPLIDDMYSEFNETAQVVMSEAVGVSLGARTNAPLIIIDDDRGGVRGYPESGNDGGFIGVSRRIVGNESEGSLKIFVARTGGNLGELTARLEIQDWYGFDETRYTLPQGGDWDEPVEHDWGTVYGRSLTWSDGDSAPKEIIVPLIDNAELDAGSAPIGIVISNAVVERPVNYDDRYYQQSIAFIFNVEDIDLTSDIDGDTIPDIQDRDDDDDGLTFRLEYALNYPDGTDDADNDGLTDGEEVPNRITELLLDGQITINLSDYDATQALRTDFDARGDADGDTANNRSEILSGTDPFDEASLPPLLNVAIGGLNDSLQSCFTRSVSQHIENSFYLPGENFEFSNELEILNCNAWDLHEAGKEMPATLAGISAFAGLREINMELIEQVSGERLTISAFDELASVDRLEVLRLGNNRLNVTDSFIATFAEHPSLRRLNVSGSSMTNDGFQSLFSVSAPLTIEDGLKNQLLELSVEHRFECYEAECPANFYDLSPLQGSASLQTLQISGGNLDNPGDFDASMESLNVLFAIPSLVNLQLIDLYQYQIDRLLDGTLFAGNISSLGLRRWSRYNTGLPSLTNDDLSKIASSFPNLIDLNLENQSVDDLTGLEGLQLNNLIIIGTKVTDLYPLYGLEILKNGGFLVAFDTLLIPSQLQIVRGDPYYYTVEIGDHDGDGLLDADDPDADGDGVANEDDPFPLNFSETGDFDGDGIGNVSDPDRDNDGILNDDDAFEYDPNRWGDGNSNGLDDAWEFDFFGGSIAVDSDDDGDRLDSRAEFAGGTDPTVFNPAQRLLRESQLDALYLGEVGRFSIDYEVGNGDGSSNNGAFLPGLSLRVHFDADQVRSFGLDTGANLYSYGLFGVNNVWQVDTMNFDGDLTTTHYVTVTWLNYLSGFWPEVLPLSNVLTLNFVPRSSLHTEPVPYLSVNFSLIENVEVGDNVYGLETGNRNGPWGKMEIPLMSLGALDIDGDGEVKTFTDGIMLVRKLFSLETDTRFTSNSGLFTKYDDSEARLALRAAHHSLLDVDGDGSVGGSTDGLMLLRRMLGFEGSALIKGAVNENATRSSAEEIAAYIDDLVENTSKGELTELAF